MAKVLILSSSRKLINSCGNVWRNHTPILQQTCSLNSMALFEKQTISTSKNTIHTNLGDFPVHRQLVNSSKPSSATLPLKSSHSQSLHLQSKLYSLKDPSGSSNPILSCSCVDSATNTGESITGVKNNKPNGQAFNNCISMILNTKDSFIHSKNSTGRTFLNAVGNGIICRYYSSSSSATATDLSECVYLNAPKYGNNVAISDLNGEHTYRQLLNESLSLASRIRDALPKTAEHQQHHIALLVPPTASFVVAQWATWMSGNVVVPLCPQHPPLQLQYFLQDSCATAVICCPSLQHLLPDEPVLQKVLLDAPSSSGEEKEEHKQEVDASSFGLAPSSDRAMILYTSGTTGDPKGVVLSHKNLHHQVSSLARAWQYSSRDVLLHCLPLHHTHGIVNTLMVPLKQGARVIMTHFKPDHIWSLLLGKSTSLFQNAPSSSTAKSDSLSDLNTERDISRTINLFMAVPTIYAKLLQHYDQHMAHNDNIRNFVKATCQEMIRLMVSGSAALPESVLLQWRDVTGHTLLERYGMTETGMALTNPLVGERKQGFVGAPFPGVEVRIVSGSEVLAEGDANATKVTPGCDNKEGELLVRGPNVFQGYWNKPEATEKEFTKDGWFKTGDTAVYTEGYYKILGRTSVDIIKSGGFKVSALAVERAMLDHPSVEDVAVVGAYDRTWGQKICAIFVWRGAEPLDTAKLKLWLRERLPSYQVPTSFLTVPELPRNHMGKVNKKQLLQEYYPSNRNT